MSFKSLRFLFVNIGYPPFVGGAQTYVQQLGETLVQEGHRVTVYTSTAGEVESIWNAAKPLLAPGVEEINGVVVKRFPLRYVAPSPYAYYLLRRLTVGLAQAPAIPEGLLWGLARFTPWVPDLEAALAEMAEPIDLVHGFTIPFESLLKAAADCARRRGVPLVMTPFLHTGESETGRVHRGYAMPHQLGLLRKAAAVIALSAIERDVLVQKGLSEQQVHVLPAGLSLEDRCFAAVAPSHQRQPPMVLFLGAVTYEKGAVHLTEAIRRLWAEGMAVELNIAGNITDQFLRYYKRLPAADGSRVQLLGLVGEEQKATLLDSCTLLAMPSRVDSFGLAYLEAWAHGKPVIGARAGGVPAVIDDGENGLLVPFGDVAALATAIRSLIEDPQEAARLGHAGWEKLRARYDWDKVSKEMLRLYQQVLAA